MVNLRNNVVVSVCLTAIGLLIILYYATRQHSVYTHCKQRLFAINIATHTQWEYRNHECKYSIVIKTSCVAFICLRPLQVVT